MTLSGPEKKNTWANSLFLLHNKPQY